MVIKKPEEIESLSDNAPTLLVKYGGNAMTDPEAEQNVAKAIAEIHNQGYKVIVVHGGGPFIASLLDKTKIKSEFIHGHRKTDADAMTYVEMALSGQVNGRLVSLLNANAVPAIGISGKDAAMATIKKRFATVEKNGAQQQVDIGYVGDVSSFDTSLISLLLSNNYVPVVSPVCADKQGFNYNINADMFAGNLAGALAVDHFTVLTDVNGLRRDAEDPQSRISHLTVAQAKVLLPQIKGGMIPKIEACLIALEKGAKLSHIIQGNDPDSFGAMTGKDAAIGTTITLK
jgi:acetylglutamate kinase